MALTKVEVASPLGDFFNSPYVFGNWKGFNVCIEPLGYCWKSATTKNGIAIPLLDHLSFGQASR